MTDFGSQTIDGFLASLAAKQPTPGGGAVAGLLSALSTSLGAMVVAYSEGKETLHEHAALHVDCAHFLQAAQVEAMELANADATAYQALNALWKLPKDDQKREAQWETVVSAAISIPLSTMGLCLRILTTLETLIDKTNTMLASDLAIAAILANAAAKSANLNVQINLPLLSDDSDHASYSVKAATILTACNEVTVSIETACGL